MRMQFCGADRTVTGSSHLLQINGLRILLDMGLYQGSRRQADEINRNLLVDPKKIDAVILSHGHLDHCGRLPLLTRGGYAGPIFCTPATAEVSRIVLNDAAAIQMENIEYLQRRVTRPEERPAPPLYVPADIPAVLQRMRRAGYGQRVDLGRDVAFTFFDAGHILGSAYVWLEWQQEGSNRRLLFTGDVGRYQAPIIGDPQAPPGEADYLISESTYGARRHAPMSEVGPQFLEAVKFCIARRSRLLVPSFAVGRTQTVLWYMQRFIQEKQIPEIPIFVDSPMGVEISKVHSAFRDDYDAATLAAIGDADLFASSRVTFAATVEQSKAINAQQGACVIIASSPTCEFGRILHHLKQSVERPDDLVVFVGYIPPATLGRRLQDGQKRVRILDRYYDVRCQVRTIHGLSAHADGDELLRFLKPTLSPRTQAWVVHGEAEQAEVFAGRLVAAGVGRASTPAMESSFIDTSDGAQAAAGPAVSEAGE